MNYIYQYPYSFYLYVMVFFLVYMLSYLAEKTRKSSIVFLVVLVLSFFSGLRAEHVGTDTAAYYNFFYILRDGYVPRVESITEPGFILLGRILMLLQSENFAFLMVAILINTLIIYRLWTYRDSCSFAYSVMIYVFCYFIPTMSGIRQWLAVSIVFFASQYLLNFQYNKFLFYVLLATTIHFSALISCILIFIHKYSCRSINLKFIFVSIFLVCLVLFPIFYFNIEFYKMATYISYLETQNESIRMGFLIYIRFVLFIFILLNDYYFNHKKITDYRYLFLRNVWVIGIIVSFIGYYYHNLSRISWYFVIFEPLFCGMLNKSKKTSLLSIMFFILAMIICYLGLKNSGNQQMPYMFFSGFGENRL